MGKCGTASEHCCWLGKYGECPYVNPNYSEEFYSYCGLVNKYGSWAAAQTSEEYLRDVQPFWDEYSIPGLCCEKWPPEGKKCNTCGEIGHG